MNKGLLTLLCLSLLVPTPGFAAKEGVDTEQGGGILYGPDHAIAIRAPEGWILDNESGAPQGLHAVFYPKGSSWEKSDAVMYVNTAGKATEAAKTLDEFIQDELQRFRQGNPGLKVTKAKSLMTNDKKVAQVRHLSGDQWGNYEGIAYIEEKKVFVMIVLSSSDTSNWQKSYNAFEQLIRSYVFLTDDVRIQK